jgi:hypothetical protein
LYIFDLVNPRIERLARDNCDEDMRALCHVLSIHCKA